MPKPHYRRTADGGTVLMRDGFVNVVANLGAARDKAAHGGYYLQPLDPAQALAAYRTAWLPRKIVDIIPLDATRRWRAWQADKAQISAIEAEEDRIGLRLKLKEAMTAARLYGGAAIYIGTGDTDVEKPLQPERIGKEGIGHLTVLTRQQISPGEKDDDPVSPGFGLPRWYEMQGRTNIRIHPSRLVALNGSPLPAGAQAWSDTSWGDSVLQPLMQAIMQADGTAANIASLIYEAKTDVLHIPRLMELLGEEDGEATVSRYLLNLAIAKGNNGMLVLDGGNTAAPDQQSGGTRYEQKTASFGGLADIWDRTLQAVSGAADIPATRLLGMSPAGLNSTGEGDLRNYYDRVQAMQELELTPALHILDECLIRSALGSRPDDIYYLWRSLWQTTDKERADIGKTTADIIAALKGAEVLPIETLGAAAVNAMIETGALPGLEAAVEEFGIDLFAEGDEDEAASPQPGAEE